MKSYIRKYKRFSIFVKIFNNIMKFPSKMGCQEFIWIHTKSYKFTRIHTNSNPSHITVCCNFTFLNFLKMWNKFDRLLFSPSLNKVRIILIIFQRTSFKIIIQRTGFSLSSVYFKKNKLKRNLSAEKKT